MASYLVTDPKSGRKVKLTGDSPPTDEELDIIFSRLPTAEEEVVEPAPVEQDLSALDIVGGIAEGATSPF